MGLRVVGAGPPRTGTESLSIAFRQLLGEQCAHMRTLPGHPFDCGPDWRLALAGGTPDWDAMLSGCAAGVDWPFSLFWRDLSVHWPGAVVLLSLRDSTDTWLDSMLATVVPVIRACTAPDWSEGRDPLRMMERFAGTPDWDDRATLGAAYERWLDGVRSEVPPGRLVEWVPGDGWEPLCNALGLAVPDEPFPWSNRREDWG